MNDSSEGIKEALQLTRRALRILDDIRADLPAIHLQQAIDKMMHSPVPRTLEEAEMMLDIPEVWPLLVRLFDNRKLH